jgi:hypothetical protein
LFRVNGCLIQLKDNPCLVDLKLIRMQYGCHCESLTRSGAPLP